jgi:hypothetical protein
VTRLFVGAIYDSNQISIYIQVYDNNGAFAIYEIPQSVTVLGDDASLETTMSKLIEKDPMFSSLVILNEGSFLGTIQEMQTLSSLLNERSLSDKLGLILKGNAALFTEMYGPLSSYSGVVPVNK